MARLIQFCTKASLYDGAFGGAVGWPAAGMGYIIKSDAGSLIVIDGGNSEDAEALIALLEQHSDGEVPTVEKWIVTHPHGDHYYALRDICKSSALYARICVKELIYYFPEEFVNNEGSHICASALKDMQEIAKVLGASVKKPAFNEKLSVGELELHFIYTPDDCSIFKGQQNANVCSLIFTVSGSKKAMFTGDAFRRSLQMTAWRFGKELKCDILQLPHHGLCDTGVMEFYKHASAETVLVPISKAGDRSMHSGEHRVCDTEANLWAEQNATAVHKAFEGTVEIYI